jgi:monoterpene epsilon-lactone hydrolase
MLSTLLLAQSERLPMPAGLVCFTPASDLSGAGDTAVANAARDLLPTSFSLELAKQNYQGSLDGKDPLFSPIYGEFQQGFPPIMITTGTRDILLSNAVRLYWKLKGTNTKVELFLGEGMPHGFNWEEILPEAVQVRKAVVNFPEALV